MRSALASGVGLGLSPSVSMPFLLSLLVALGNPEQRNVHAFSMPASSSFHATTSPYGITITQLADTFYNDFEGYSQEDDEDDDDDFLLVDNRDWRTFRKNLSLQEKSDKAVQKASTSSVSKENEEVLESQSKTLFLEYKEGVWAHETSTPEIGGLMVRMPLEIELLRNHQHSLTGSNFRKQLARHVDDTEEWYHEAKSLIEQGMVDIAGLAGDSGQIDATTLPDDKAELLTLYLDNQESWQEVCLVLERDMDLGTSSTLVLNRPMAFQLTENLARLVLHGEFSVVTPTGNNRNRPDLHKFIAAFGSECAVYIGGPDDQGKPAEIIHGIKSLKGAHEIAPGTGIYRGGLAAAVDGVLKGLYQPLDFRFFVGKHIYTENLLDLTAVLGKYQPVAASRALALKQCISLPKPLWHEVLEWVGGDFAELSELELTRSDDLKFKIIDDEYEGIVDELDELERFDDEEDDEDDDIGYYRK